MNASITRRSPWLVTLALVASACTGFISSGSADGNGSGGGAGAGSGNGAGVDPQGGAGGAPVNCDGGEQPGPRVARLLTRLEYATTVSDLLGIKNPAVDNLPVEPKVSGFDNNAAASVVTSRHIDEYLATADRLARVALTDNRAGFLGCDSNAAGCDRTFVEGFGKKAFRRALTPDEITRYLAFFAADLTGGTFDEGAVMVAQAILSSSSFLYRFEVGEPTADGFALTAQEIATALSYTFWGTTPDTTLLSLAESGALRDPAQIEAQAKRLFADPRARPQVAQFFNEWLDTSALLQANKDAAIYPGFTADVRESLAAEQAAFVNHVVFDGTHAFGELFDADYVFVNGTLSSFYGLAGGSGTTLTKVSVDKAAGRGGILTLGSVLASQAHSNESSPIKRGVFVRSRLLCQNLAPPPPNANTTPPGLDPSLTTRERFAKHTSDPTCKSCHRLIDGVGFGFERYDGVGAYRGTENGKPVDDSGVILNRESLSVETSDTFNGPRELGAMLAQSPQAQACVATQYFRYARGFVESGNDTCAARSLASSFKDGGLDLQKLLLDVVRQKSFLVRRDAGEGK